MLDRVIPYALARGYSWYVPDPVIPGEGQAQWVEYNRLWIRERMAENCLIVNIGLGERYSEVGPYYGAELEEIANAGYTNVINDPQP